MHDEEILHEEDVREVIDAEIDEHGPLAAVSAMVQANVRSSPITGGNQAREVLVPSNDTILIGSLAPWSYAAGKHFGLQVITPTFSAGTLTIVYAEINVSNMDGSERIAIGLDAETDMPSGHLFSPLPMDNGEETPGAGSDLTFDTVDEVVTAAGGILVVTYHVKVTASSDFAV